MDTEWSIQIQLLKTQRLRQTPSNFFKFIVIYSFLGALQKKEEFKRILNVDTVMFWIRKGTVSSDRWMNKVIFTIVFTANWREEVLCS